MKRLVLVAAIVLLAVTVIAVQPTSAVIAVDLDVRRSPGEATVSYSVGASDHLYELIISVMPADLPAVLPDIVIIDADDSAFRSPAVNGLYDHITVELRLRGMATNVTIVNIDDLDLSSGQGSILVFAEAVETDNETASALMAWVMDGGRLICIGPDSLPFRQEFEDGEWQGPEDFLRVKYRGLNYTEGGAEASAYAEAFHLKAVAPRYAMEKEYLDNISAVELGYAFRGGDADLVTATMVPLGDGRLVLFGGPMSSPAMVSGDSAFSWDIVQLYAGGALWSTGLPEFVHLPSSAAVRAGNFTVAMNDGEVVVMAYSLQPYVPVYGRTVATAS